MSKKKRTPGRDRRLRQRLFAAGNTMCPICLAEFTKSEVAAGSRVTLEHAPPKSLGGSVICLTCEECNNNASLVDQHAYLSKKARDQWSSGQGAPIVVDFFGQKKKLRYFPKDPAAPYPARKHLMRNGVFKMGPLPFTDNLDANKGIGFRIPQRDDYELVSMVKSAYLMVFSLMGANGYRFARNIGLTPIREQIMNPNQKILKSGFIVESQIELGELKKLGKSVIFLVHGAKPPFWLVPLWDNRAVILSCGSSEPIDELRFDFTEGNVPIGALAGWVVERFDGSASIASDLCSESDIREGSLAGTVGGPLPTSLGKWIYVSVFHQGQEFVALPLCPEDNWPRSEGLFVVDMLTNEQAISRNLDLKKLAGVQKNPPGGALIQKAMPSNDASK